MHEGLPPIRVEDCDVCIIAPEIHQFVEESLVGRIDSKHI